jgi:hypothetical protein
MKRAVSGLVYLMLIAPLYQQLNPRGAIPVGCVCDADDSACRITNCSKVGSGTGTGSSGTSTFVGRK